MAKCYFSGLEARVVTLGDHDGVSVSTNEFGDYWITRAALDVYFRNENELSKLDKLKCLQESINLNREGLLAFWSVDRKRDVSQISGKVVSRTIDEIIKKPVNHRQKDMKILMLLGNRLGSTANPFAFTQLTEADLYSLGIFDDEDLFNWLDRLRQRYLVAFNEHNEARMRARVFELDPNERAAFIKDLKKPNSIRLSVDGWEKVQEMISTSETKNAFIAMAFTDRAKKPLTSEVRDTIKQTLTDLDFNPVIVDEVEHNDGIMDKVVASIKESKFVIAELTHQKSGVYYEAGFAKGLGLPVIHIVQEDDFSECHFDVKHLNLIVWKKLEDLAQKLSTRIRATIG